MPKQTTYHIRRVLEFTPASQILQPFTVSTPQDFSTIVKSCLLEPNKQILLTELIEDETEEAFNKVMVK